MEVDALTDKTIQFSIKEERDEEMRQVLRTVYDALGEKGYNPISQDCWLYSFRRSNLYHHAQQCEKPYSQAGSGRIATGFGALLFGCVTLLCVS